MTHIAQGWQCPQCRSIYAPTILECIHCPRLSARDQHKQHAELDRAYQEFVTARDKQRASEDRQAAEREFAAREHAHGRTIANLPLSWPHPDGFAGGLTERGE